MKKLNNKSISKHFWLVAILNAILLNLFACKGQDCKIENLNGCWWFLYDNSYWEICWNGIDHDVYLEGVYSISGSQSEFNISKENCSIEFYRSKQSVFKITFDQISETVIDARQKDTKLELNKITSEPYGETMTKTPSYYDKYVARFQNRMMINKHGLKREELSDPGAGYQ